MADDRNFFNVLNVLNNANPSFRFRNSEPTNGGKIPIRKIYVNAVNRYPTRELAVIHNFEAIGFRCNEIKNVQLSSTKVFFFVMFFTTESAARALEERDRLFKRFGYKVSAADQWHQPLELTNGKIIWDRRYMEDENEDLGNSASTYYDESKPSLMDLNDDVLLLVLEKLTLKECIGVERVCKRMRSLCLARWTKVTCLEREEFASFFSASDEPALPVDHLREILLRCGANLQSLDLSLYFTNFNLLRGLPQIIKHCPNLKKLDLTDFTVDMQQLQVMSPLLNKLTSFHINNGLFGDEVLSFILKEGAHLEELELMGFTPFSIGESQWKFLNVNSLVKLKKLGISGMVMPFSILKKTFPNLTELRCQNIKYCPSTDDDYPNLSLTRLELLGVSSCVAAVIKKCPKLEILRVSAESVIDVTDQFIESIVKLDSLKSLAMLHLRLNDDDFAPIVERGRFMGQLEKFCCHACCQLSSASVHKVYDGNPGIKSIDVSCSLMNLENLLRELNEKHRDRVAKKKACPLDLIVANETNLYWPKDDAIIRVKETGYNDCETCDIGLSDDDMDDDGFDFDSDDDSDFDSDADDVDGDEQFMMHLLARQGIFDHEDGERPGWVDYYDDYY